MRWFKDPLKDNVGDIRIIKRFLWFPKCIKGECRWLERARFSQRIDKVDVGGSMEWGNYKHKWRNMSWEKDE